MNLHIPYLAGDLGVVVRPGDKVIRKFSVSFVTKIIIIYTFYRLAIY